MAKDIYLKNQVWEDVPAVDLPIDGGGKQRFTDVSNTTAVPSDVASGKLFFDSTGTQQTGTSSGGGASNLVTGTFTTGSSAGYTNISTGYTGNGYPIACMVFVEGGAYVSGTTWYTTVQRYAVGQWSMSKADMSTAPSYTTSGSQNRGVITAIYKSSTSSSTSYSRTSAMTTNVFSSNNASNSAANTIKLKSGNVLSYYTNTSSYGLMPNITYRYYIIYSE